MSEQPFNTELFFNIKDRALLQNKDTFAKLSSVVNDMLLHRFNELINLLYRIDVDENKLRKLLSENQKEDAGNMIAQLMIERQIQKLQMNERHQSRKPTDEFGERW